MRDQRFKTILLGLTATFVLATTSAVMAADTAPASVKPGEASIPFANHGGISSWNADGTKAMYLQGRDGKWYHAEFMNECFGLNNAEQIAYVTDPRDTFDKFSSIMVDHMKCQVSSLTESGPPPKKEKPAKN